MRPVSFLVLLAGMIPAHVNAASCLTETMPEGQGLVCSAKYNIRPDTGEDVSGMLNTALVELSSSAQNSSSEHNLYLPAGEYLVGNAIKVKSGVDIVGSQVNPTILRSNSATIEMGDHGFHSPIRDVEVRYLFLDNVRIRFYGSRKKNIRIKYNCILNTKTSQPQIEVAHVSFEIHGNVLLRGDSYAGVGISTYKNVKTTVSGNYIGDLSHVNMARNHIDPTTEELIGRLQTAVDICRDGQNICLAKNQGNFVSAWYATDGLADSRFTKNFINGNTLDCLCSLENPQPRSAAASASFNNDDSSCGSCRSDNPCCLPRNHVIYIKQYERVEVSQNFFRGWPAGAHGQVKFRNASYLYFAGNYLDAVSFNARPYNTSDVLKMDHTFILNNFVKGGDIDYWQNFTDTDSQFIDASDFVAAHNLIDNDGDRKCSVRTTSKSTHGEFLSLWNRHQNGTSATCSDFKEITTRELGQRLTKKNARLIEVKTLPIAWQELGSIGGSTPSSGEAIAVLVLMYAALAAEAEYTVDDHSSVDYRWPKQIAEKLNALQLDHIKAGNYDKKNNSFVPIASSYQNKVWIGSHIEKSNAELVIFRTPADLSPVQSAPLDWQDIGVIGNVQLTDGDTVVALVLLGDECIARVEFNVDGYWSPDYRWPAKIAEALNNEGHAGLKAGDRSFKPAPSSSQNKVWVSKEINAADARVVLFKKDGI